MSFKAKVKIEGQEDRNALKVTYRIFQEVDATGRPSSITKGGLITITTESTAADSNFAWVTDSFQRKNGSIEFLKRDTNAKSKELSWTEGYLVDFIETFDADGTTPLTETYTISAKKISYGTAELEKEWV